MRITEEVEGIAWSLTDDSASERPEGADLEEGEVLVEVAKALTRAGKHQNAVRLALAAAHLPCDIHSEGWDQSALEQVALVLAETCQYRQFVDLDRTLALMRPNWPLSPGRWRGPGHIRRP